MRLYNWINEMMDDRIVDDSGNQWYIRPVGRVGTKKKGKSRRPKF